MNVANAVFSTTETTNATIILMVHKCLYIDVPSLDTKNNQCLCSWQKHEFIT